MKVEVSRFNASIFELVNRERKERAFLRREDPEFLEALQVEAAYQSRLKKIPFRMGRLLGEPKIEITEQRWQKLRARISGAVRIARPDP